MSLNVAMRKAITLMILTSSRYGKVNTAHLGRLKFSTWKKNKVNVKLGGATGKEKFLL